MTVHKLLPVLLAFLVFTGCSSSRNTATTFDNGKITVKFLQINDVYEIAPIEAGKSGGLSRVAHLSRIEKANNPNTFFVLAGDFLSPSVYNSLKSDGVRIRGKQMVETLNAAGLDLAVFGNHEFDISESELQSRLNESTFDWISSNSFHKTGTESEPFYKQTANGKHSIPAYKIISVRDADGTQAKIGILGLNIPFNKAAYVGYTDPLSVAEALYNKIKDSCDAVVAITHQTMESDVELAKRLPRLALIIGGHEHDMRYERVGDVLITKAHANARSVYVINLSINTIAHKNSAAAKLEWIDDSYADDKTTLAVVNKWTDIAEKNYTSLGFNAYKIVMQSGPPLEAREAIIRNSATNFSKLVVNAMEEASPESDVAIVNAGSIRPDDVLNAPVTQYDILRSMPFGGAIVEANMNGNLLTKILEAGQLNKGSGGFLHYSSSLFFDAINKQWMYKGSPIDKNKTYRVALTDFLLTGGEANLGWLTKDNKEISKVFPVATSITDSQSDIRLAIIRYMERHY